MVSRLASSALALALSGAAAQFSLTVLHTNDHHSHLTGETMTVSGSKVGLSDDVKLSYGGYPRYVSAYGSLKAAAEAKGRAVLKLHAGDAVTGTSYYSLFKGRADAEMMSRVCFDAFGLGNHEFDDGDANLAQFIDSLHNHSSLCDDTPVVAANVVPGASSPLQGKLVKSHTVTLNGEEVGIVGIDIRNKTMQSSSPDSGTVLTDERAAAQSEINELTAAGVNKIILLTHIGYNNDKALMATLSGVDAIVGGDSHSLLGDANTTEVGLTVAGEYPTVLTNGDGKSVCVSTAWEYSKTIGNLEIEFDSNGDVTSCGGRPVFPYDATNVLNKSSNTALGSADLNAVLSFLSARGNQFLGVTEDAATKEALDVYANRVASLAQEKIASVPADICYDRFPGQGRSSICPASATQEHGGGACQLVAKAFLAVALSADIALQNAGGCRTDIAKGDFTHDDAYTMLPFSNMLVTLRLTGAQLKSLLEDALDFGLSPTGSTGAYPYAAGLRFDVEANASKGARFHNIEVNSRLADSWAAVDDSATYTVVTNSYIASGKDGYATFTSTSSSLLNLYIEYAEGLVKYSKQEGTLVEPPLSEFSTQAYIDQDGVVHSTRGPDSGDGDTGAGGDGDTGAGGDASTTTLATNAALSARVGALAHACAAMVLLLARV